MRIFEKNALYGVIFKSVVHEGGVKYLFRMNNKKKAKELQPANQMEKLGQRIRQLRKAKGYTSAEKFANDHGFPRALYGRYEKGRNIQFITLVKLANSFGITLTDFFSEGFDE